MADSNTPLQIDLVQQRLESIFLPHIRRRRETARKRKETQGIRFAHYTSAEAALKIIRSKRVWMRSTPCMVDYQEVQHGFGIIDGIFKNKTKSESFIRLIEKCAPSIAANVIARFNIQRQLIQLETYVASVSEHDDSEDILGRLSMWRAFGGGPGKVALVFELPWTPLQGARELGLTFSPVEYLNNKAGGELFCEMLDKVGAELEFLKTVGPSEIEKWISTMLLLNSVCLKHEGFREEKEWRAVYFPHLFKSSLMEVEVEIVGGIPQRVCKIPLDGSKNQALADLDFARIFNRLIIGPSQFPWPMYQAFASELERIGVADAQDRVRISKIPIRT